MCGFTSYQDPRLQPPESGDEPAVDVRYPSDCAHGEACRALLARLRGYDVDENVFFWEDKLSDDLGCDHCEMWEDMG